MQKKYLTKEQAHQKVKQYCAYQERSHSEVKKKLYSFGLYKHEVELLIAKLIEDDYLNEERFAIAFAGGKFRIRQWGKVKIKYELKQRGVSNYCIQKALASIDEKSYMATLNKLYVQKLKTMAGDKGSYSSKAKLLAYLTQKGYETKQVYEFIKASK